MTAMMHEDVRILFAFVDCGESPAQLDALICGWSEDGTCYVLGHRLIPGNIRDSATQEELAELLDRRFEHPYGGTLRIGAAMIDEGSGLHSEAARQFRKRMISRPPFIIHNGVAQTRWRYMYTSKGVSGSEFIVKKSDNIRGLMLIGVDQIKAEIFILLKTGSLRLRFSDSLSDQWYKELTSEHRVSYDGRFGQVRVGYEKIVKSARNEALDCLVGCFGLYHYFRRKLNPMAFAQIEARLRKKLQQVPIPENMEGTVDQQLAPPPKPFISSNHYPNIGADGVWRPERSPGDDPNKAIPPERPAAMGRWMTKKG
jgi:phage terminase large subunit GpA-like protein